DMEPRDITAAMQFYKNLGMRQNISVVDGITIIADCYNASPDSMKAAIDVISSVSCQGRRIAVLGDMLELGGVSFKAHTDVGVMVASGHIDLLLCVGKEAKNIAIGAYAAGMKEAYQFDTKEEIIKYLKKNLHKDDAVIFKASRGAKLEEVIDAITK
ncbi:MAG: cyanophycin synthetase, partial [Oscillospiraceae bacterium]